VRRIGGAPNRFERTDAVDVFDCVAQALATEFERSPTSRYRRPRNPEAPIRGKVLARFKKAGRDGRGMNLRNPRERPLPEPRAAL